MHVLLLSRQPRLAEGLAETLAAAGIAVSIEAPEIGATLDALSRQDALWRRWLAAGGAAPVTPALAPADILIADETLPVAGSGRRAEIAPLVPALRAAGQAAVFVSLSSDPDPVYDLQFTRRPAGPFDLHLSTPDLLSPGLWSGAASGGAFRPWTWPVLAQMPARRARQIEILEAGANRTIADILDLPDHVRAITPSDFSGRLCATRDLRTDPVRLTDLLASGALPLESADRHRLPGRLLARDGTAPSDPGATRVMARLLAPVLEDWMARSILDHPAIALDSSEVLTRTGLPGSAHQRLAVTGFTALRSGGALRQVLAAAPELEPVLSPWTDKAWIWTRDLNRAVERDAVTRRGASRWVFCDDTSRFRARAPADAGHAPKRASPELGRGLAIRWIERVPGVRYAPACYLHP